MDQANTTSSMDHGGDSVKEKGWEILREKENV